MSLGWCTWTAPSFTHPYLPCPPQRTRCCATTNSWNPPHRLDLTASIVCPSGCNKVMYGKTKVKSRSKNNTKDSWLWNHIWLAFIRKTEEQLLATQNPLENSQIIAHGCLCPINPTKKQGWNWNDLAPHQSWPSLRRMIHPQLMLGGESPTWIAEVFQSTHKISKYQIPVFKILSHALKCRKNELKYWKISLPGTAHTAQNCTMFCHLASIWLRRRECLTLMGSSDSTAKWMDNGVKPSNKNLKSAKHPTKLGMKPAFKASNGSSLYCRILK